EREQRSTDADDIAVGEHGAPDGRPVEARAVSSIRALENEVDAVRDDTRVLLRHVRIGQEELKHARRSALDESTGGALPTATDPHLVDFAEIVPRSPGRARAVDHHE